MAEIEAIVVKMYRPSDPSSGKTLSGTAFSTKQGLITCIRAAAKDTI